MSFVNVTVDANHNANTNLVDFSTIYNEVNHKQNNQSQNSIKDSFLTKFSNDYYQQSKVIMKQNSLYRLTDGSLITYNDETYEYYKTLRKTKCDPITNEEIDEKYAFKFPYEWDPYTGERKEADPYGPLCFNPDILIKYFHTNRLINIWCEPVPEDQGMYDGWLGDAVGNGPDFNITSRGTFPEWYLFRLPITNCYLTSDHNDMIVTMGPKLTLEEITEIDRLAKLMGNTYELSFGVRRPSLLDMYTYYTEMINPEPKLDSVLANDGYSLDDYKDFTKEKKDEFKNFAYQHIATSFRRMRG